MTVQSCEGETGGLHLKALESTTNAAHSIPSQIRYLLEPHKSVDREVSRAWKEGMTTPSDSTQESSAGALMPPVDAPDNVDEMASYHGHSRRNMRTPEARPDQETSSNDSSSAPPVHEQTPQAFNTAMQGLSCNQQHTCCFTDCVKHSGCVAGHESGHLDNAKLQFIRASTRFQDDLPCSTNTAPSGASSPLSSSSSPSIFSPNQEAAPFTPATTTSSQTPTIESNYPPRQEQANETPTKASQTTHSHATSRPTTSEFLAPLKTDLEQNSDVSPGRFSIGDFRRRTARRSKAPVRLIDEQERPDHDEMSSKLDDHGEPDTPRKRLRRRNVPHQSAATANAASSADGVKPSKRSKPRPMRLGLKLKVECLKASASQIEKCTRPPRAAGSIDAGQSSQEIHLPSSSANAKRKLEPSNRIATKRRAMQNPMKDNIEVWAASPSLPGNTTVSETTQRLQEDESQHFLRKPSSHSSSLIGTSPHHDRPAKIQKNQVCSPFDPSPLSTQARQYLLDISKSIMAKTAISEKPPPRGCPDVWADSRQALCETVLYYQAWQGACYISKGVLYSFMFDSNGHDRDLIDHDVIIARAGGCMAKDKATGEMYQTRDQRDNNQTAAVRAAIDQQIPIVVFCGSMNSDAPTKMPARYCSLGWFKVTHLWAEETTARSGAKFTNIKYRFEKLKLNGESWWAANTYDQLCHVGQFEPPVVHTCLHCHSTSQQVYLQGWMCLMPTCPSFWLLPHGVHPVDAELSYDPRFLKQRTTWQNEQQPFDIRPVLPQPGRRIGDDVVFAMTRGMCCPKCGKCTSRYLWSGWICSNLECDFRHEPPHQVIPSTMLRDPWHPVGRQYATSIDWVDTSFVRASVQFSHNYRIARFQIPGIEGSIYHMVANKTIIEEPLGPDAMFEALQTLDCGLERRRFVNGKEEFMTAFSNNRGMPYKFIASGESTSFDGAPWPLTETRSRLNWAARLVLGSGFAKIDEFNELLTIGYFDGQNIKYHDDGEHGLGPTVASISLGYPADMLFRVKAKHWTGVSKSGVLTDSRPIPGTMHYDARLAAYEKSIYQGTGRGSRLSETRKSCIRPIRGNLWAQDETMPTESKDETGHSPARTGIDTLSQDVATTAWSHSHSIYSPMDSCPPLTGDQNVHRLKNQDHVDRDQASASTGQSVVNRDENNVSAASQDPSVSSKVEDMHTSSDRDAEGYMPVPCHHRIGDECGGTSRAAKLREVAKSLGLEDVVSNRKPWLRLRLSHGDIVVMHGRQIQEYLEHQVDPLGRLRFALTCRTILPQHLRPSELPDYEVKPDDGHYDGSGIRDLVTDGD